LLFGLIGDASRTWLPGQLDLAVWAAIALLTATLLVRAGVVPAPPQAGLIATAAWLLLPCLVWRDSDALLTCNVLALFGLAVLAAPATAWQSRGQLGVFDVARGSVTLGLEALAGPLPAATRDIPWGELPVSARTRRIAPVVVGLAAAIPVLLLFGSLFGDADPLFRQAMLRLFDFDIVRVIRHLIVIGVIAWLSAGALRGSLWRVGRGPVVQLPEGGRVPAGTVLAFVGSIGALFALFVAFQARELFLDSAEFQARTGVTIAEYARQGFFELLAVAALTLPMLLGADWLLARSDASSARWFHRLTAAVLVLLALVLASAYQRMFLYLDYYGLSEDRFYALVFLTYLAAVFGWFVLTVLRGRRPRFIPGALGAGYLALILLNLVNPDAVVARVNLQRAAEGAPLDVAYLGTLSADLVPTVLEALPGLPAPERCALEAQLRKRWGDVTSSRAVDEEWNLSRELAARRLAALPTNPACAGMGP